MIKLKSENLSHKYNKSYIFKNINFEISEYGVYIITGNNGSGKSTLLKILAKMLKATKGEVYIEDLSIGYSAPYLNCIDDLSVEQNIKILSSDSYSNEELNQLISEYQLKGYLKFKASQLSSGLYQRLKLLLASFKNQNLLFLDEPSSNLDLSGKSFLKSFIDREKDNRVIIISTNEEDEKRWGKLLIDLTTANN